MIRYCPRRVDWSKLHIHPETTSRLAPLAKSGDNRRVARRCRAKIAACLMANISTDSKDCVEALQKIEANSIAVLPPQEIRAGASKKTA
jgi:hypothetical protein